MADSEFAEPKTPKRRLRRLDLSKDSQRHGRSIRNPRSQAGRCWLLRSSQAQIPRGLANHGLRETSGDQGEHRTVLNRRPLAGAVVAQVIHVHAQRNGCLCRRRNGLQSHREGLLAVITAIPAIGLVVRLVQLMRGNGVPGQAPFCRQGRAIRELVSRKRRGHCGNTANLAGAELIGCHPGQEGGICPARKRHHQRSKPPQLGP